jgi:hypothetical protein
MTFNGAHASEQAGGKQRTYDQTPETKRSITGAINRAITRWQADGKFSMGMSQDFWTIVFRGRYGKKPSGYDDPLWSQLFKEGFPALREINRQTSAHGEKK